MDSTKQVTDRARPGGIGSQVLRFAWRWIRRGLLALATVIGALLLILSIVQWTAAGRAVVLGFGLEQVNALIPGTLRVQRLDRLSLFGVDLKGVEVLDPHGTEVLTLEHFEVSTDWKRLILGDISLHLVRVSGLRADAQVLEERRGLLAAFVDPDAPESPPSPGPPPNIHIRRLDLSDLEVRLQPLEALGQLDLEVARLTGGFHLMGGIPVAQMDEAEIFLRRGEQRLVHLSAQGKVKDEDKASHLQVHVDALGMSVDAAIDAFLPHQEGWRARPIVVELAVQGVRGERLAELLEEASLRDAFSGTAGLSLRVEGTIDDLRAQGVISTNAGEVRITEIHAKRNEWRMGLLMDDFALSEIKSNLPSHRVTGALSFQARGVLPDDFRFKLDLRGAKLDGVELLDVELGGRLLKEKIEDIDLLLSSGDSKIRVEGNAGFDGSAQAKLQIDLRPRLVERLAELAPAKVSGRLRGFAQIERKAGGDLMMGGRLNVDEASGENWKIHSVETNFALSGSPPDLGGTVKVALKDAFFGGAYVDSLELDSRGGAKNLELKLRAQLAVTPGPERGERPSQEMSGGELMMSLSRQTNSTRARGSGSGKLMGRPWEFALEETEITDAGALDTGGIVLSVGGQKVAVSGKFGGVGASGSSGSSASELRIESQALDLARLAQLLELTEPLVGRVDLNGRLRGSFDVPNFELEIVGHGLGMRERPLVEVKVKASLDAEAGRLNVESEFSSAEGLELQLSGDGRFVGGAGALERLVDAEGKLSLRLGELRTQFLEPYLPKGSIPFPAILRGNIQVEGSSRDPRLDSALELTTTKKGDEVRLKHHLKYAGGTAESSLTIKDAQGSWANSSAHLKLAPDPLTIVQLALALPYAARDAEYRVELKTSKRELRHLPFVKLLAPAGELPPVTVESELLVTHQAGAEPDVNFRLQASQSKGLPGIPCADARGSIELSMTHKGKDNELNMRASIKKREALSLRLAVEQALLPLIAGQSPAPGPVALALSSAQLDLNELPFLCGTASGRLSLEAEGSDLLGRKPLLQVEGGIDRLGLGGRDSVDLELEARADHQGVKVEVELRARERLRGKGATLNAELPWRLSEGNLELEDDLPFVAQLRLRHLPIAALLPPKGPISYARGGLDGEVRADGTISSPQLAGEIRLEDLGFTSAAIAQPLRDVRGRLLFAGRKVELRDFEAHDRDGTLSVNGVVDLSDPKRVQGEMHIVADDFPIRQTGQVVAITNLKADARSTVTPEGTEAHLHLSEVDTWLENAEIRSGIALLSHQDFNVDGDKLPQKNSDRVASSAAPAGSTTKEAVLAQSPQSPGEVSPPIEKELRTHIVLEAVDRFWIKREDFAVKLSLLLDTEVEGDAVRVKGDVIIDRGYLLLFGKPFDLKRESQLRFIGSNPPDPILDIEASHKTREGVIVAVRITGRGSAPVVVFIVDDAEVDASIAVQALFGSKKSSEGDDDPSNQAQSFVSALSAGVLATAARRELGAAAPILMIDPDDAAGQGRVRAGFELDEVVPGFLRPFITGIYLEGIVAREAEGEAAAAAETNFGALLEIYFPKNLYSAGQYGPGTTWSVDFGWQPF
jgi:autotransporter translocation and assembly factor TamB